MSESRRYSESIHIAADPDTVYATVSDITRTGEWSPICRDCWWDEGDGPRVGAWFTGLNVTAEREWKTRSQVTIADEGRSFGWSVGPGYVLWTYTIAEAEQGSRVTESWEFTPAGQAYFVEKYGDEASAQMREREAAAHSGIPVTLAAIKRVIESQ